MYSTRKAQRNMSTGRWVRIRRHRPRGCPIPYLLTTDGVSLPVGTILTDIFDNSGALVGEVKSGSISLETASMKAHPTSWLHPSSNACFPMLIATTGFAMPAPN
jgi:hypothetical protein